PVTSGPNTQSKPNSPALAEQTSAAGSTKKPTGIEGIVTDESGAVVKGAVVTVHASTGVTQTAVTDDAGAYRFTGLSPGTYDASVTAPGFGEFKTENYNVTSGEMGMLDAQLVPASVATNVKVEGQGSSHVETETAEVSGTISQKQIESFGLNGRIFSQLLTL